MRDRRVFRREKSRRYRANDLQDSIERLPADSVNWTIVALGVGRRLLEQPIEAGGQFRIVVHSNGQMLDRTHVVSIDCPLDGLKQCWIHFLTLDRFPKPLPKELKIPA